MIIDKITSILDKAIVAEKGNAKTSVIWSVEGKMHGLGDSICQLVRNRLHLEMASAHVTESVF